MEANEIINSLSEENILQLLSDLNCEPIDKGETFDCLTVCHGGDSHKLIYHKDSRRAYCFTNCGSLSLFDLVKKAMDLDFGGSVKYITNKFNISNSLQPIIGFASEVVKNPGDLLGKFINNDEEVDFKPLDKNILNDYYNYYHKSWIDNGISVKTMKKFNIRFNILDNQIVIPHFDKYNNLIGVRARNLNDYLVAEGKKYMPIYHDGKVLKHLTGANLYGLSTNEKNIKSIKKVILFESEKGVMQLDTMWPEASIGICLSGSALTNRQLTILKQYDINEVIIGVDKEFEEIGDDKEKMYAKKIEKIFVDKLKPYFSVSVLWDTKNLLKYKDSPTDEGLEVFNELFKNRINL